MGTRLFTYRSSDGTIRQVPYVLQGLPNGAVFGPADTPCERSTATDNQSNQEMELAPDQSLETALKQSPTLSCSLDTSQQSTKSPLLQASAK
jgi:hypothetical protein